ncbi:hypothetical protein HA402_012824 [Bradysia odoriphaga]|nr:hypothetical protein HA402_012824 [Bradysia odoriphaga]
MDFVRRIRKNKCESIVVESLEQLYPFNVKFYYHPPANDIDLRLLEDTVIERLKVLHILEQTSGKYVNYDSCAGWKEQVLTELKFQKLFNYVVLIEPSLVDNIETLLLARERDYISHFMLRFYFCESEVLRQWFVDRETELFRLKFDSLSVEEEQNFLRANNLHYVPQSYREIWENQVNDPSNGLDDLQFFKIKFTEVLQLVSARKCILKNGFAYVTDLCPIIETIHRTYIDKGLLSTNRIMNVIREDVRIVDLLKVIHSSRPGHGFELNDEPCNFMESVDDLSKQYFPLCARMCHETLRERHHLKYFGRNQYQLFLKGIGVSLEDSLKFWIEEFTHDNKDKPLASKYRYQIEFNYGTRGSRIDIAPPSCTDLISMNFPSFQQCYGCPYKFLEPTDLKATLTAHGLNSIQVDEVLSYSDKNDYQLACTKYFECVNDYKASEVINSPNRYFDLCQMIKRIRSKRTPDADKDHSLNDLLYDKHLWEELSPTKDHPESPAIIVENVEPMTQFDFNY